MAGLNVCVGIDAGSSASKVGYSDNLSTRIIARLEGLDLLLLREEAEIFFDEPVFSCVVAVNSGVRHEDIRARAGACGFREVNIITAHEAMGLALSDEALVYDFGASRSELTVLDGDDVLESVIVPDVCGSVFDGVFVEYLAERIRVSASDALLREARRIKHVLSEEESIMWHGVEVFRTDFDRLIRFSVKRAVHTADRLIRVHRPERIILTGGCANIPMVREEFSGFGVEPDIIAVGASLKARTVSKSVGSEKKSDAVDMSARLRELRANIIELEDRLTRGQKDRIYMLFRQAEGINDAGIIATMENMMQEIRQL